MLFTADHEEPRRALQKFIAAEINPSSTNGRRRNCLFKKLGDLGFLGLNKPAEFGGQGLDYSYALMMAEELGAIRRCGGVPMRRRRRNHADGAVQDDGHIAKPKSKVNDG
jgi:citronellyl-CoA dehydrogenase